MAKSRHRLVDAAVLLLVVGFISLLGAASDWTPHVVSRIHIQESGDTGDINWYDATADIASDPDAYVRYIRSSSPDALETYAYAGAAVRTIIGQQTWFEMDDAANTVSIGSTAESLTITLQDTFSGTQGGTFANTVTSNVGAATQSFSIQNTGDSSATSWTVYGDGEMYWGKSGSPLDTLVSRTAADTLSMGSGDDFAIPNIASCVKGVITDASGVLGCATNPASQVVLTSYVESPSRTNVSNTHGGLQALTTGAALDSTPTDINIGSKGPGKLLIVVNAGSDTAGDITVTGTSIDRDTGATTGSDTDTITIAGATIDTSSTDANGNQRWAFSTAYISSKWFMGTTAANLVLSTTNLTLTDIDVYHVSFEQFNDAASITLETFDVNLYMTNSASDFDSYLYTIEVTGDECDVTRVASLNIGSGSIAALANEYFRMRRGNLGIALDGSTDGIWVDTYYSSPVGTEDVTMKVWATVTE